MLKLPRKISFSKTFKLDWEYPLMRGIKKSLEVVMWERIKIVTSSIWVFVLPYLKMLMSKAGPILAAAALEAVKVVAANASGATDDQKRNLAFQAIGESLKVQGIAIGVDVSTALVNAAIETAVLKLKSE